jgi:hypothetical protein
MTSQWSAMTAMPVIPGLTRDPVPHVPWIADRVRNDRHKDQKNPSLLSL